MMRNVIRWAGLLCLSVSLTGCDSIKSSMNYAWDQVSHLSWDYGSKRKWDAPIEIQGADFVSVDVESFNGNVFIEAGEDYDITTVEVCRKAMHGPRRPKEAKGSLDEIAYTIDITEGQYGPVLVIRATTSHPEPHYQAADIYINAPAVDGVSVHTTNGKVHARGIAGPVDVTTTNGDVRVLTNQPMLDDVTIINRNGDIVYRVRGESAGVFDGETVRGKVVQHTRYGQWVIGPGSDHDSLHATFNNGTNPILMRTVDGDIIVAVVQNPEEVGYFVFE